MKTYTGIVAWFDKGYGFIKVAPSVKREFGIPEDKDLFFHAEGIIGRHPKPVLEPEQRVRFNIKPDEKGPRAYNIVVDHNTRTIVGRECTMEGEPQPGTCLGGFGAFEPRRSTKLD